MINYSIIKNEECTMYTSDTVGITDICKKILSFFNPTLNCKSDSRIKMGDMDLCQNDSLSQPFAIPPCHMMEFNIYL